MGLEIFSLMGGFPFLPGPLERSSTVQCILSGTINKSSSGWTNQLLDAFETSVEFRVKNISLNQSKKSIIWRCRLAITDSIGTSFSHFFLSPFNILHCIHLSVKSKSITNQKSNLTQQSKPSLLKKISHFQMLDSTTYADDSIFITFHE